MLKKLKRHRDELNSMLYGRNRVTLEQMNVVLRIRNERNLFLLIAVMGWIILGLVVMLTGRG